MSYSLALRSGFTTFVAIVCLAGCGGDGPAPGYDGGVARNHRLVVLDPPGEQIGLAFGASIALRVRYETETGEPLTSRPVSFTMVSTNGSTGGSSLSALSATTDGTGVAEVNLTAGAEQVEFRVEASAADAPTVSFYIGVSNTGFAEINTKVNHSGWRAPDTFTRIEVRLYRAGELRCGQLDADAPPASPFPPRTLTSFGGTVSYENLIAHMPYTLVGWAIGPDDITRLAMGCVDLAADAMPPRRVVLELLVRDRMARWPATVDVSSQIDLSPVVAAVADTVSETLWRRLACPVGVGQLLVDCALDAALDDGVLDCEVNTSGPLLAALESQRAEPDTDGCRPAVLPGGGDSIDQLVNEAMLAGDGFPGGAALVALLDQRNNLAAGVGLDSSLSVLAPGVARHRLMVARVSSGSDDHVTELAQTARPVLEQAQVGSIVTELRELELAEHGFTLRIGSLARAGFRALSLAPHGLADKDEQLGTEMIAAISDSDSGTTGCDALSAIACTAAGQPATCLQTACGQAKVALDAHLADWWRQLDGTGLDLTLSGSAPVRDEDHDLIVDRLGADANDGGPGLWNVSITLRDGTSVPATGEFVSVKKVP